MTDDVRVEAAAREVEEYFQDLMKPWTEIRHHAPYVADIIRKHAALAAADRVGNIKSLNEQAKGEHCDLDYRPDAAERVANDAVKAERDRCELIVYRMKNDPRLDPEVIDNAAADIRSGAAIALSPGKVSEDNSCDCGAGHGSLEGHTNWCAWVKTEKEKPMLIPPTEREALAEVMTQTESDLATAHAEICKLQGLDPAKHSWPEWTMQANSLRWFKEIRAKFKL